MPEAVNSVSVDMYVYVNGTFSHGGVMVLTSASQSTETVCLNH